MAENLAGLLGDLGIDQGLQLLVLDDDGGQGSLGRFLIVGGNDRHGLAPEASFAVGQNGLVSPLEAEEGLARNVLLGEDRQYAGHRQRGGDVQPDDASLGKRAAQGGSPQHPVVEEIGGVREIPGELGDPIGAPDRLTDAPFHPMLGRRRRHEDPSATCSRARMMAP